jgi:hypothetical protein
MKASVEWRAGDCRLAAAEVSAGDRKLLISLSASARREVEDGR